MGMPPIRCDPLPSLSSSLPRCHSWCGTGRSRRRWVSMSEHSYGLLFSAEHSSLKLRAWFRYWGFCPGLRPPPLQACNFFLFFVINFSVAVRLTPFKKLKKNRNIALKSLCRSFMNRFTRRHLENVVFYRSKHFCIFRPYMISLCHRYCLNLNQQTKKDYSLLWVTTIMAVSAFRINHSDRHARWRSCLLLNIAILHLISNHCNNYFTILMSRASSEGIRMLAFRLESSTTTRSSCRSQIPRARLQKSLQNIEMLPYDQLTLSLTLIFQLYAPKRNLS